MDKTARFSIYNNLDRFKTDKKLRDYTHVILTLAAVSVFLMFAIRPSVVTAISLFRDIQDLRSIEENTNDRIETINSVREDETKFNEFKTLIDKAIPTSPEEGNFIRDLYFSAAKYNVQIERISFIDEGPTGKLSKMRFNIEVTSNYENLVSFLSDLNKHLRIVNVNSLSIKTSQTTNLITTDIVGVIFFIR